MQRTDSSGSAPAAAMPNPVELWQTALRQLQQLPTELQAGTGQGSGLPATLFPLPAIGELGVEDFPTADSTVWEQLLNELKVNTQWWCINQWSSTFAATPQPMSRQAQHGCRTAFRCCVCNAWWFTVHTINSFFIDQICKIQWMPHTPLKGDVLFTVESSNAMHAAVFAMQVPLHLGQAAAALHL